MKKNFEFTFCNPSLYIVAVVQALNRVQLFVIPWTAALQASLFFTISWSLLKLMSIELVMPSNRLILCSPFSSCLQYFPASGSFLMSQLFSSGSQSIGASASASVLPMNIRDWFPGFVSLLSKGLLSIFFNTTVQTHHFFYAQSSLSLPAAAAAKSPQSCPTLCNPIDGSPPGSLVPGILQARTLEWVAI